jgi:hypothetical protein
MRLLDFERDSALGAFLQLGVGPEGLLSDLQRLAVETLQTDENEPGMETRAFNYRSHAIDEDPSCRTLPSEIMDLLMKAIGEPAGRQRDVLPL